MGAGAWRRRVIAATIFRNYYVRGDLPICVDHRANGSGIRWKIHPSDLDFHVYLPIFFDGLREARSRLLLTSGGGGGGGSSSGFWRDSCAPSGMCKENSSIISCWSMTLCKIYSSTTFVVPHTGGMGKGLSVRVVDFYCALIMCLSTRRS